MARRIDLRRLARRDLPARLAIRWRVDVVRRFAKDALDDQRFLLADVDVGCILDVGANVGHLTTAYRQAFPDARVVAFEVAPRALGELRRRVGGDPQVTIVERAVADTDGQEVDFHVTPMVGTSSLLAPTNEVGEVISVTTVRLDDWCRSQGIDRCNIVKLDIEGAELQALDGAAGLLSAGAIDVVYCEVRLQAETEGGALLHEVTARLAGDGYRLHNLYGAVESEVRGTIYANAVYLSPRRCQQLRDRYGEHAFIRRLGHRSGRASGR